jgi:acyl-ACP thioesterase
VTDSHFSEIVPPPAHGRVYRDCVRPGFADCAPSGRARLDGLARWLQDVAYADVVDAGLAEAAVWVVRRTRLRVHRFPRFGEQLQALTFCSGMGAMWAERRTTITLRGGAAADVEAVALWVHLDRESWRPVPFGAREIELYGEPAGGRRVRARLHHPAPPDAARARPWCFRATECDVADHVNNAAYWVPVEEELLGEGGEEPESFDAEIEFRHPAQPGQKSVLTQDDMRWITGRDGEVHASVRIGSA